MLDREIDAFAKHALVLRNRGTHKVGRQVQNMAGPEIGVATRIGQFDAIAFVARESDFEGIAIRLDRMAAVAEVIVVSEQRLAPVLKPGRAVVFSR